MVAAFYDVAFAEDEDIVGVFDGGEAVGDDEGGAAFHEGVHGALDDLLGAGVDGRGGFIQDKDWLIGDDGTGDGELLLLTLREADLVIEDGVVAVW